LKVLDVAEDVDELAVGATLAIRGVLTLSAYVYAIRIAICSSKASTSRQEDDGELHGIFVEEKGLECWIYE